MSDDSTLSSIGVLPFIEGSLGGGTSGLVAVSRDSAVALVKSTLRASLLNPFTTALFVLFAFGAILYGWGSNISGHCKVII